MREHRRTAAAELALASACMRQSAWHELVVALGHPVGFKEVLSW